MARITVEDCLKKVESRFELVLLAAGRAKMLLTGAKPVVEADNRQIVTALREVAEGKVEFVRPEAEEIKSETEPESAEASEDT
jgi:DNA-directed RNA polymerase subunit omega